MYWHYYANLYECCFHDPVMKPFYPVSIYSTNGIAHRVTKKYLFCFIREELRPLKTTETVKLELFGSGVTVGIVFYIKENHIRDSEDVKGGVA